MQVKIHNHYTDTNKVLEGTGEHLAREILRLYPWLHRAEKKDIKTLVETLNHNQAYTAAVEGEDDLAKSEGSNLQDDGESHVVESMLGYHSKYMRAVDSARFLAGGKLPDAEAVRQALYEADGDPDEAALISVGLEPSERNLKALKGIQTMTDAKKAEGAVKADTVEPGHPDASETAEEVERAFKDEFVVPVKLGGKHSAGSLLARDRDSGNVWLLKPGSGGQTPAAGAKEEAASQSRREAAFWHVADEWGLSGWIPRCDLLIVDGREYATIKLLPWSFKSMDKVKAEDPNRIRDILGKDLREGNLHHWAVLDFVLGNPDRHANNLMVRDGDVKLIDHGSAMAGPDFDPAHDKYSFTPFYLRAWAPPKFSKLSDEDKLKYMPRLDKQTEEKLRSWIDGLHAEDLDKILYRYGVNPAPARARLAKLKAMVASEPADLAINKLWATT